MLWPTVRRPVYLGVKPHLGPKARFLLLSYSCRFVDGGRPLWLEIVYSCCWPRQRSHFLGPNPAKLMTLFYCSDSRLPQPGGPGPCIYIPQALDSLFVASYDSLGYGGAIRTRLHTGAWLSVRLGAKALEVHNQNFLWGVGDNWTLAGMALM
jgi:hypothetical protein